jgi:hypothetical protein
MRIEKFFYKNFILLIEVENIKCNNNSLKFTLTRKTDQEEVISFYFISIKKTRTNFYGINIYIEDDPYKNNVVANFFNKF